VEGPKAFYRAGFFKLRACYVRAGENGNTEAEQNKESHIDQRKFNGTKVGF